MRKLRSTRAALVVGTGLCVLLAGTGARMGFGKLAEQMPLPGLGVNLQPIKQVNTLKTLPPKQRVEKLTPIAQSQESIDRSRARYLLAIEQLQQQQPQEALKWLDGLEQNYTVLAPYILARRAEAYGQLGDGAKATAAWQALLQQYGNDPASVEALYALGRENPQYWDQAIAKFPAHPRSVEIAQQRLKQNPKQPQLLRVIARYGLHTRNYLAVLDQLTEKYAGQLTPEDWEAIGFGYWERQIYGKAGAAYARAPFTARNAYRTARGLQLGERGGAREAYLRVVAAFPKAEETSLALLRLARISDPKPAIGYLDLIVQQFPDRAGEALLERSKTLEKLNSQKAMMDTRKLLLERYSKSDAAAELRWTIAQERAKAKDYQNAWKWAQATLHENPDSEFAPQAGFWVGKWAADAGQQREARTAFEKVLSQYPDSYYAWRSASLLGWQVGDFNTVRELKPNVNRPAERPDLPIGSPALKELHQIGQDQEAWELWQTEFANRMQPNVAEQFTDGVMRLGVGDYLDGIFMISFLKEREKPEERAQVRDLKREMRFWQALYPFPYQEAIANWSQERQLNPLLVTALIRQESRFMPGIQSSVGATGLMQVMPDTAAWIAKQTQLKQYTLNDPEDNIKLGTWYLDYTHREYSGNSLFAVASYNAGPGAVGGWVQKRAGMDLDEFVESIPYDETRGYVKSVFENYWNYLRLYNSDISQQISRVSKEHPGGS